MVDREGEDAEVWLYLHTRVGLGVEQSFTEDSLVSDNSVSESRHKTNTTSPTEHLNISEEIDDIWQKEKLLKS